MHPHPYASSADTVISTPTPTPSSSTVGTISTASSTVSSTAASTTTAVPHALFLYPTTLLTLNNIDVIQVGYRTIWNSVNLTVFCEMGPGSNEYSLANMSELQPNGTYAIAPIQAGMQIPTFPTFCNFMLINANNNSDYTTAAGFTMVSTQGIPTTYASTVTQTAAFTKPISISTATHFSSTSASTASSTTVAGVTSPASGETTVPSEHQSTGLSGGAKAGIAIGVILGISVLAAVVFLVFMRHKRRKDKLENMAALRSTASSVNLLRAEKAAATNRATPSPSPVPTPSPPPDISSPRVEVFKIGESNRNSEDWRRFFGNGKAQVPGTLGPAS